MASLNAIGNKNKEHYVQLIGVEKQLVLGRSWTLCAESYERTIRSGKEMLRKNVLDAFGNNLGVLWTLFKIR